MASHQGSASRRPAFSQRASTEDYTTYKDDTSSVSPETDRVTHEHTAMPAIAHCHTSACVNSRTPSHKHLAACSHPSPRCDHLNPNLMPLSEAMASTYIQGGYIYHPHRMSNHQALDRCSCKLSQTFDMTIQNYLPNSPCPNGPYPQGPVDQSFSGNGTFSYRPVYSMHRSASIPTPSPSAVSRSPESEWFSMAPPETDIRHQAKRMRLTAPVRSSSPVLRSDGIRKKNARFEIPADRTIDTIDNMINEAKDDDYKKELKTQKRLLRNREAALQSRHKKKLHTEHLEEENKHLTDVILRLEEKVGRLTAQAREHEREKESWHQCEAQQRGMQLEQQQLVEAYATENSKLLDKIEMLERSLQDSSHARSMSMPVQTPSTGYAVGVKDMTNAELETRDWDGLEYVEPYSFDILSTSFLE